MKAFSKVLSAVRLLVCNVDKEIKLVRRFFVHIIHVHEELIISKKRGKTLPKANDFENTLYRLSSDIFFFRLLKLIELCDFYSWTDLWIYLSSECTLLVHRFQNCDFAWTLPPLYICLSFYLVIFLHTLHDTFKIKCTVFTAHRHAVLQYIVIHLM